MRFDIRTDGSAQTVVDAVESFLGHNESAWRAREFGRARLRVELVPHGAALWRGARLVALRHGRDLVWNLSMYDVRAAEPDNAVLAMLLLARQPNNFADKVMTDGRLLRLYEDVTGGTAG